MAPQLSACSIRTHGGGGWSDPVHAPPSSTDPPTQSDPEKELEATGVGRSDASGDHMASHALSLTKLFSKLIRQNF